MKEGYIRCSYITGQEYYSNIGHILTGSYINNAIYTEAIYKEINRQGGGALVLLLLLHLNVKHTLMPLYDPMARQQLRFAATPPGVNMRRSSLDSSLHHGVVIPKYIVNRQRNSISAATHHHTGNNVLSKPRKSLTNASKWLSVFSSKIYKKDGEESSSSPSLQQQRRKSCEPTSETSSKEPLHYNNGGSNVDKTKSPHFLDIPKMDTPYTQTSCDTSQDITTPGEGHTAGSQDRLIPPSYLNLPSTVLNVPANFNPDASDLATLSSIAQLTG